MKYVLWIILALPLVALGDEAPAQSLSFIEQAVNWLNHVVGGIPQAGAALAGIGVVVEMLFRFIKSEKPKSVLYGVARTFELLAQFFVVLAEGFRKLAVLMNKILPQRLKSDGERLEGPK